MIDNSIFISYNTRARPPFERQIPVLIPSSPHFAFLRFENGKKPSMIKNHIFI